MGIAIHKVVRRTNYESAFDPSQLNFTHGVASGDPYPDSVILVWQYCDLHFQPLTKIVDQMFAAIR